MLKDVRLFSQLRQKIHQTGKRYRCDNDNSQSLFHPIQGFVYAYEIYRVEAALDEYAQALHLEPTKTREQQTVEQQLMQQAQALCATHPQVAVRDFARTVAAYLLLNANPGNRSNPMGLLRTDFLGLSNHAPND